MVASPRLAGRFLSVPLPDVWFGQGSVRDLADVLARDGIERAFVITGRTLAGNVDTLGRITAVLGNRHAGTFADTIPHVPRGSVLAAAEACRAAGADAIVSFGGSTPNDTAKAATWALAEDIRDEDGFDRFAIRFEYPSTRIEVPISGQALPIYAVPTTLSAGEFTAYAGVTDLRRRHKDLFRDRQLLARAVFLDPELTLATPERLWLSTGIKAVDHCVEAWLSTGAQPLTDALTGHALGTLLRCLPTTRRDPANLSARLECQIAAWMSVLGLSNVSLGLSHGLGHQFGAVAGVPHGLTSCIVLPRVVGFNHDVTADRQAALSALLGVSPQAEPLQQTLLSLIRDDLGLPWRLRDVGVSEADLPAIAAASLKDPIVATNPRPIRSSAEVEELLRQAW